jgi:predicted deacetylase
MELVTAAKYLLRFDDVCPGMNWTAWREVQSALDANGVRPLVAIVPDNRDAFLNVAPARPDFWEQARRWRSQGWTIGLHGYQHVYSTSEAGIIGRNRYSEFAGLGRDAQLAKMRAAMAIFAGQGVTPQAFVAPAHSFDEVTLEALAECGIRRISDGYSVLPNLDARGLLWIPQQLGRFRRMPVGIWTVCCHINAWTPEMVRRFARDLERFGKRIAGFEEIVAGYAQRRPGLADRLSVGSMQFARSLRFAASHSAIRLAARA